MSKLSQSNFDAAKAKGKFEEFADYADYCSKPDTTESSVANVAAVVREESIANVRVILVETVANNSGAVILHVDSNNVFGTSRIWVTDKSIAAVADSYGIASGKQLAAKTMGQPFHATCRGQRRVKGDTYLDKNGVTQTVENDGWNVTMKGIILPKNLLDRMVDAVADDMVKHFNRANSHDVDADFDAMITGRSTI